MVRAGYYRYEGRIQTVHAVSLAHGWRLLKKNKLFKVTRCMYLVENRRCDPQSGQPCYYHLVAQPDYGQTPEREILPNSPEDQTGPAQLAIRISPRRQRIIDTMHRRRPDLYG
jgi:hypothetical protein